MGKTYYSHDGMIKVEEGKVGITLALRLAKKSSENDAIELRKKIYDKIRTRRSLLLLERNLDNSRKSPISIWC